MSRRLHQKLKRVDKACYILKLVDVHARLTVESTKTILIYSVTPKSYSLVQKLRSCRDH